MCVINRRYIFKSEGDNTDNYKKVISVARIRDHTICSIFHLKISMAIVSTAFAALIILIISDNLPYKAYKPHVFIPRWNLLL